MSASSESACECVVHHDWPDDAEECREEYTGVSSNNAYHGLVCSRPEGHDDPHAACTTAEHPVMVWPQNDEGDSEDRLVTDGGHRKAWQSTSVDVVESDVIVHNNGDETYGLVLDLGDTYVVQIVDLDDGGFQDGDVIAATRTPEEAVTILEDWEGEHINGLAPDSGWKQLFK